jgi:hypothetical protein
LSYSGYLNAADADPRATEFSSQDFVRAHWEFIRRYMESGPQEVCSQVKFCMPIGKNRERFRVGAERVFANFARGPLLLYWIMFPFCLLVSIFRWVAMRTSKVPQWPHDVETSSTIEPNDPYAIEGAPDGERVAVFPEAALAAGVRFCNHSGTPGGTSEAADHTSRLQNDVQSAVREDS